MFEFRVLGWGLVIWEGFGGLLLRKDRVQMAGLGLGLGASGIQA